MGERYLDRVEVTGSSPVAPTMCERNSAAERMEAFAAVWRSMVAALVAQTASARALP